MIFTDKFFLIVLILIHRLNLTIAKPYPEPLAEVQCYPPLPRQSAPQIADCQAAINAIPAGTLEFGSASRSPDLMELPLPPSARKYTYQQKPIFRSGSCFITIDPGINGPGRTLQPGGLAKSALYFKVFPAAREGANKILRECLMKAGKVGIILVQADLYGQQRSYEITIGSMNNAIGLPEKSGLFWGGAFYMHAVDRDGNTI